MLFGPDAMWDEADPPAPDYAEDAHARQFNRDLPQFDAKRFAERAAEML
jgi:hypothetical protein